LNGPYNYIRSLIKAKISLSPNVVKMSVA